jgi:hypothetical protein
MKPRVPRNRVRNRRGQSLVEFALVALVMYMILAAILTFGHALYVAQGLQQAADLGAREISRTPLPVITPDGEPFTFDHALDDPKVRDRIFNPHYLVVDLDTIVGQNFFPDVVSNWPVLNQQLATLMILDRPVIDGVRRNLLRYPGALLKTVDGTPEFTVGIPIVSERNEDGIETIRWVSVVEEIEPTDPTHPRHNPFTLQSELRGIVALRINFPFQSASMSSFRRDPTADDYPFEATIGRPNAADDFSVGVSAPPPPDGTSLTDAGLTQTLADGTVVYAGTYGGQYGLGAQGALGSQAMTGGRPVRPYRRVISAQAIYRREVFE